MEILDAPLDGLSVRSLAGTKPPISCLNDGLQASTGASLGRGSIEVSSQSPAPTAVFYYNDEKITLKLKPLVEKKIRDSIQAAIDKYGDLTPQYFAHMRELSIRFWLEFDRMEIFEEITE